MTIEQIKKELIIFYNDLTGLDLTNKTNIPLSSFKNTPTEMDSIIFLNSIFDLEEKYKISLGSLQEYEIAMAASIDILADSIFNEMNKSSE